MFSFINLHEYANEIIFIHDYWMNDLSNFIFDEIITCNKDSLGQNFLNFSILISMQIR